MQKIPTIFVRDESQRGHPVTPEWKPECYWVRDGEGQATQKIDGTNVKIEGGNLLKRQKPADVDGQPVEYTNASYVPCHRDDPQDKWLWAAFDYVHHKPKEDGIYEAAGKHIQGNPHNLDVDCLYRVLPVWKSLSLDVPDRTYEGFRAFFEANPGYEGIVFHHPDGRMAKIKRRDFGLPWPVKP